MLQDIIEYFSYLTSLGWQVSVHYQQNALPALPPLCYIHSNPYCLAVKSSPEAWSRCIQCQKKVLHTCSRGEFYGMCYAGMEEFVFPLQSKGAVFGFVSVSGFCQNRQEASKRIEAVCWQFGLEEQRLARLHRENTVSPPAQDRFPALLLHPLCHMLVLWQEQTKEQSFVPGEEEYLFSHVIAYLQEDCGQDMTVARLSQLCHCSVSYISHLFKRKTGLSISEYKNERRIEQAKSLLETTSLPIGEIAQAAGFTDPNYFSSLFRKKEGQSPLQYRKKFIKETEK